MFVYGENFICKYSKEKIVITRGDLLLCLPLVWSVLESTSSVCSHQYASLVAADFYHE